MVRSAQPWHRTFLIIFTGQAFSLLGSSAVNFALVWWLTAETGSASVLAYASIAALVPQAVVGLLAGPFVDRWDRRRTMMGADLFVAVTSVVLLAMVVSGNYSVLSVIAVLAARSLGAAFHTPASQAAVPMYVPQDQLMRVSGWNFFLGSGVAMAGPVLGAFLMGVAPMTAVLGLDIVGALVAVGSLLLVRIPHPERSPEEQERDSLRAEFVEGWRELVRHRGLFHLTIILTVVTLLYMPLNALFPLMTFDHFGGGAFAASIIEMLFGAGMLVGSLVIGALSARFSAVALIGTGILVAGLMLAASGLLPPDAFWVFAGLSVIMGVSVPLFGAPLTAMFQTFIDPSKLGRVMSLYMTMALAVSPLGLLVAGPVAEETGVAPWFAVSGTLIFITGLFVWVLPAPRSLGRITTFGSGQVAISDAPEGVAVATDGLALDQVGAHGETV